MLPIRKPATPGRTPVDTGRQIAYLTIGQSMDEHITSTTVRIAPLARNIGNSGTIRRPRQAESLARELTDLTHCATMSRNQADLPPIPVRLLRASSEIHHEPLPVG